MLVALRPLDEQLVGHLADQEGLARLQHLRDSLGLIEVGRVAAVEVPRELLPLGNAVPYGKQPDRAVGTGDVNRAPVGEPGYHQPHEVPHDDVEVERPVEDLRTASAMNASRAVLALLPGVMSRMIAAVPVSEPSRSRRGESVSETSTSVPSLRSRCVWWFWTGSPVRAANQAGRLLLEVRRHRRS